MNDNPAAYTVSVGLPDQMRADAARLYLEAFRKKLGPIIGHDDRALTFLGNIMRPQAALVAISDDGHLLGIAGFHDENGGFIGGGFRDMVRSFGYFGALWRAAALSVFEREPEPDELLMDGVVVHATARGKGVGTALLMRMNELARQMQKSQLRLDVVDTNPRARALYERQGFVATRATKAKILKPIFGFSSSTTMMLAITTPGSSAS